MQDIKQIATEKISKPKLKRVLKNSNGLTNDIIVEVLRTDKASYKDTINFAPYLRCNSTYDTCKNIWDFVKSTVKYKVDEMGIQDVKTPARTFHDKFADCKSYSIFIASILRNLGIDYKYRFVSFRKNDDTPTHVYIVVPNGNDLIIIDDVLDNFNEEKPFTFNKDFNMTQIYAVSGIEEPIRYKKIIDLGKEMPTSHGELDIKLYKDSLQTDQKLIDRALGVGNIKSEKVQNRIDVLDDMIEAIEKHKKGILDIIPETELIIDDIQKGNYVNHEIISGIASIPFNQLRTFELLRNVMDVRKRHRLELALRRQLERNKKYGHKVSTLLHLHGIGSIDNLYEVKEVAGIGKTWFGNALRKVATNVKKAGKFAIDTAGKVGKFALKFATAPMRLAAKAVLEVLLPKSAMFFIYTFIPEGLLSKAPKNVITKRNKAKSIKKFIVDIIGMKESHFNQIVSNGIKKQTGKTPETYLINMFSGKVSGIGLLPLVALIPVVIKLVGKLASAFGKKAPEVSKDDAPNESDFGNMTPSQKQALATGVRKDSSSTLDDYDTAGATKGVKTSKGSF